MSCQIHETRRGCAAGRLFGSTTTIHVVNVVRWSPALVTPTSTGYTPAPSTATRRGASEPLRPKPTRKSPWWFGANDENGNVSLVRVLERLSPFIALSISEREETDEWTVISTAASGIAAIAGSSRCNLSTSAPRVLIHGGWETRLTPGAVGSVGVVAVVPVGLVAAGAAGGMPMRATPTMSAATPQIMARRAIDVTGEFRSQAPPEHAQPDRHPPKTRSFVEVKGAVVVDLGVDERAAGIVESHPAQTVAQERARAHDLALPDGSRAAARTRCGRLARTGRTPRGARRG